MLAKNCRVTSMHHRGEQSALLVVSGKNRATYNHDLLDVSFDNFSLGPYDGKVTTVDAKNVLVAFKRLIRQTKPEDWDV